MARLFNHPSIQDVTIDGILYALSDPIRRGILIRLSGCEGMSMSCVKACEKLPKGAKVAWSFEARSRLDFNIHFHEGKQVRFPAKKNQVAKDAGTLNTKVEQDYCWMWTNKGAAETTLNLKLTKG